MHVFINVPTIKYYPLTLYNAGPIYTNARPGYSRFHRKHCEADPTQLSQVAVYQLRV